MRGFVIVSPIAKHKERLGQVLAGDAHPRRILLFESPLFLLLKKEEDAKSILFFFWSE